MQAGEKAGNHNHQAEDESSGGRGRVGGDQTVEVRCGKACSLPPPAADTDLTDQQRGVRGEMLHPPSSAAWVVRHAAVGMEACSRDQDGGREQET